MKKLIFCLCLFAASCNVSNNAEKAPEKPDAQKVRARVIGLWDESTLPYVWVIEVDSCQYLLVQSARNQVSIIHKADCPNPAHGVCR